nr:MAG TPA: hypothetical protein [Caudoviricetes sp.]
MAYMVRSHYWNSISVTVIMFKHTFVYRRGAN